MEALQFLKEYWFLMTVAISVLTAVSYMVVFQVTPWEKYNEISDRNEVVKLHNDHYMKDAQKLTNQPGQK
ncbi:MAG: hypothetical protein ACE5FU_06925 [Nitrospinota bacterium]